MNESDSKAAPDEPFARTWRKLASAGAAHPEALIDAGASSAPRALRFGPADARFRPYRGDWPLVAPDAAVDPLAVVIGRVALGAKSSVYPMAVLRGDVNWISIGDGSNVQDGTIVHVQSVSDRAPNGQPTIVGKNCTIGHQAMLHGCKIGDEVLVGMAAVLLDGCVVQNRVLIGAGALVPPGKVLESGYLYIGSPARKARPLTEGELAFFEHSAEHYIEVSREHERWRTEAVARTAKL